jgi:hypothetical protein
MTKIASGAADGYFAEGQDLALDVPRYGDLIGLTPNQMHAVLSAAGVPPLGWDHLPSRDWLENATQNLPLGRVFSLPPASTRIEALQVLFAFRKLLRAFSELRASLVGLTEKKNVKWLNEAAKMERKLARHYAKEHAALAFLWATARRHLEVSAERERLANRFSAAADIAAQENRKSPLVLLMRPLEEFFQSVFGMAATGGWSSGAKPKRSETCEAALNQADSAFINVAAAFLEVVGTPYKKITIQTDLYRSRRKASADRIQNWFAQHGLEWQFADEEIRQVMGYMKSGLSLDHALSRFAYDAYEAEERKRNG